MAEVPGDRYLQSMVVADFSCSLAWVRAVSLRIGIDVLADRYADAFPDDLRRHEMIYLTSTEWAIPLPNEFVDVMFEINATDHVQDFVCMCDEILRVLKPGGLFIGSFNLG